jgi:predicted ATP-dependent endonuclease of OLD family
MKITKERKKSNLTGVFLENFQSLRAPAYIKLKGITMLYGPNSAGKSSILDALDFIHKLNDDDDNTYRTDFLWKKMCREQTRIGISYIGMPIKIRDGVRQENWIKKEINNSFNHLDFINGLIGREVFVEFSNFCHTGSNKREFQIKIFSI